MNRLSVNPKYLMFFLIMFQYVIAGLVFKQILVHKQLKARVDTLEKRVDKLEQNRVEVHPRYSLDKREAKAK